MVYSRVVNNEENPVMNLRGRPVTAGDEMRRRRDGQHNWSIRDRKADSYEYILSRIHCLGGHVSARFLAIVGFVANDGHRYRARNA
jgi:hypothetical protein